MTERAERYKPRNTATENGIRKIIDDGKIRTLKTTEDRYFEYKQMAMETEENLVYAAEQRLSEELKDLYENHAVREACQGWRGQRKQDVIRSTPDCQVVTVLTAHGVEVGKKSEHGNDAKVMASGKIGIKTTAAKIMALHTLLLEIARANKWYASVMLKLIDNAKVQSPMGALRIEWIDLLVLCYMQMQAMKLQRESKDRLVVLGPLDALEVALQQDQSMEKSYGALHKTLSVLCYGIYLHSNKADTMTGNAQGKGFSSIGNAVDTAVIVARVAEITRRRTAGGNSFDQESFHRMITGDSNWKNQLAKCSTILVVGNAITQAINAGNLMFEMEYRDGDMRLCMDLCDLRRRELNEQVIEYGAKGIRTIEEWYPGQSIAKRIETALKEGFDEDIGGNNMMRIHMEEAMIKTARDGFQTTYEPTPKEKMDGDDWRIKWRIIESICERGEIEEPSKEEEAADGEENERVEEETTDLESSKIMEYSFCAELIV